MQSRVEIVMQVRHVFTLISEFAIRDHDNRFSFINVINNVVLDEIPGGLPALYISVAFEGGEGLGFSVALVEPNKTDLFRTNEIMIESPTDGEKANDLKRVNCGVIRLAPAVFLKEGVHTIVLRVGNKVIHRQTIPVIKRAMPAGDDDGGHKARGDTEATQGDPVDVGRAKPKSHKSKTTS